jgi:hypothetical protein
METRVSTTNTITLEPVYAYSRHEYEHHHSAMHTYFEHASC